MAEGTPTLALGTVQWGMRYGVANREGQPSARMVRQLIDVAFAAGVNMLDTARVYGDSEAVIGQLLTDKERKSVVVVTKLDPNVWVPGTTSHDALGRVEASLHGSIEALGADHLDALLLHRPEHRRCCAGLLWNRLLEERKSGRIGRLGVSAPRPSDAFDAISDPDVEIIQVAASIMDQRLVRAGFFDAASKAGKEVHVRSIFLQGAAFLSPDSLPSGLGEIADQLRTLQRLERSLDLEPGILWLLYGRTLNAQRLVIGTESVDQLRTNLEAFDRTIPIEIGTAAAAIDLAPDRVLDPALWPLNTHPPT